MFNSTEVLINNILTLLRVRLNNKFLHLLNSKIQRNNLCNAEECTLKDCVSTVAKTNLLSNLCCVDIIYFDVVFCEVSLNLIRDKVYKFLTVEDCVQQECTVVAKTTSYIIHVKICLNVTCYEVRSVYLISRVDWIITETKVRTCETTRLLRVVAEICLTVFISVVTNNLNRVLVCTYSTISTKSVELSLEQ